MPYVWPGVSVVYKPMLQQTVFFADEWGSTAEVTCDPGFVLIYNNASRASDTFDGKWPVSSSDYFHGTFLCEEVPDRNWEVLRYDWIVRGFKKSIQDKTDTNTSDSISPVKTGPVETTGLVTKTCRCQTVVFVSSSMLYRYQDP